MAGFRKSYKGIGEMLTAEFMIAEMKKRAEAVEARAVSTAPDAPELGEGYISSFVVESGIKEAKTRRAFGRVKNTSPHAIYVEFGGHELRAHRTLGKALDAAK